MGIRGRPMRAAPGAGKMSDAAFTNFMAIAFVAMLALLLFAIIRGRKVIATNASVVENQKRLIDLQERNLELNQRAAAAQQEQAEALRQIAQALARK